MARQPAGSPLLAKLIEEYEYDGLETCAADGTCATTCPLGIDTGVLVKGLRAARARRARGAGRAAGGAALGPTSRRRPRRAARRRRDLPGARRARPLERRHGAARRAVSAELVPEWEPPMPPPAETAMPPTARAGAAAVYLPACVNRIFGRDPPAAADNDPRAAVAAGGARRGLAARRASRSGSRPTSPALLRDPVGLEGLPQRGRVDGRRTSTTSGAGRTRGAAGRHRRDVLHPWPARDRRRCSSEANAERLAAITILDSIAWACEHLLARAADRASGSAPPSSTRPARRATSASTTSSRALAGALAEEVVVPDDGDLLRLRRRPRLPAPGADRRRRPPPRRARSRPRTATPTSAPTGPARSG